MVGDHKVPTGTDAPRLGNAAAEAALGQYLTGAGNGPSTGGPFQPTHAAAVETQAPASSPRPAETGTRDGASAAPDEIGAGA